MSTRLSRQRNTEIETKSKACQPGYRDRRQAEKAAKAARKEGRVVDIRRIVDAGDEERQREVRLDVRVRHTARDEERQRERSGCGGG